MKLFNLFKRKRTDQNPEHRSVWKTFSDPDEIRTLLEKSKDRPQLIYKHSNRCSVSFITKDELDSNAEKMNQFADLYIVDVIRQRDISNAVTSLLKIRHESPQALLIKDENIVWKGSHWEVNSQEILSCLKQ
ncbi:MAG: bacillithiol system redox-active protein YtxJ [Balneolaceae bacterium]|nr:bacillithiol system redox-active protein YtxJ [Balneolaceae bacterium]